MNEEGRSVSKSPEIIFYKIRTISAELIRALEDGRTLSELTEVVHRQTRELARVFHQLNHLHTGKEGEN